MIFGFLSHEYAYLIKYEYSNITLYVNPYIHLQDWRLVLKEHHKWFSFLVQYDVPFWEQFCTTMLYHYKVWELFFFKNGRKHVEISLPEINWKPFVLILWRIIVIFLTICHEFRLKLSWLMCLSERKKTVVGKQIEKALWEINFHWIDQFALKRVWFWFGKYIWWNNSSVNFEPQICITA